MNKETLFKPRHKLNIMIYSIMLIGIMYLSYTKVWNQNMTYVFGILGVFLLISEILKQRKSYVLKINDNLISYKDERKIIYWKDIESFQGQLGFYNTPSKLIFSTKTGTEDFKLENYSRIHLDKVLNALTERKHKFDSKG